jgi:hypothetical protein
MELNRHSADVKQTLNGRVGRLGAKVLHICRIFVLTLAATYLATGAAWAQGLNVPAGSTFNVNNGILNVSGSVVNAGTLVTTTGTITLTGDWTNSGTFTPGTGNVDFNGTGSQTLVSGGIAQAFFNLTHSGSGTVQLSTNPVDVNNNFSNTAGTFSANAVNMQVAEGWNNTATFAPGTGTVTFDGTTQLITGSTSFYNFVKTVAAADTLTFDNTGEQTIGHSLTLTGAAANLLSLRSDTNGSQWNITLLPGGVQNIHHVDVKDSDAGNGVTLVAGATSTDSLNNINWVFGATTLTWDGSASTDWDDPFNWDLGLVPTAADSVVIPAAPSNQPVLSTNTTVTNLTINNGATLTLNGKNLTVATAFSNDGNVKLNGTETVTLTQDTNSGTFTYVGNGDGVVDTRTIIDFGGAGTDYFNLVINDPNATKDIFQTNANLTLGGALTVTAGTLNTSTNSNNLVTGGTVTVNGGTFTATNSNIDDNGGVVVSSGTFTAPTGGETFTVAGNFTHSGGTFTPGTGTVTLDGTNQSLAGSTTFFNLNKTVLAAATLTLDNTATQTVTNNLVLVGASGVQQLSLVSDSAGNAANLTLSAGGLQTISNVNVADNDASGGLTLVAHGTSTNSGGNTNWLFGGATLTWDGSTSTDWDTPANWDLGFVPNSGDNIIIPNVANQPVLASNVSVGDLTLQASTTLTLNGKNLTAGGVFSNDGNVIAQGQETIALTQDTNSGTFTFVGNGDGVVDTRTITDFGATDYFNLVINDTHVTKDIFQTNGNLSAAGAVTITAGTMNTSTNSNSLTSAGTLTVNGGTLTATNGTIDANGAVVVSSGTLTAPSGNFTVAGDFTHSGGTFTNSSGSVVLDGANQAINGSSTFFNLTKSVAAAATLTIDNTATETITNHLTLTGAAANLLSIRSDVPGTPTNFTLTAGGLQTINLVDVADNDASGGLTLVAHGASVNSGNNTNWVFGTASLTWDGSADTSWDNAANWDLGFVPFAGDNVTIPNVANQPVLASNVSVGNLTLQAGTTLTANGFNLTAGGTFSNDGNVVLKGNETVTLTQDTDSGTFTYVGNGDGVVDTRTITDFGATDYFNLIVNDANVTKDIFQTNGNLTLGGALTMTGGTVDISTNSNTLVVPGDMTINGGTLTATNGNIDVNGSVIITSGTLTAPGAGKSFTIADDFTHSGGTFTNSSGNVTFDDNTKTTTFTGNTTFFDFTSLTPSKIMLFTDGTTQTVQGTFNLQGTAANKIVLNSTTLGNTWDIAFPNGVQSVTGVNVRDSNALTNTVFCLACANGGNNNANWVFGLLAINTPADTRTVGQQPVIIGVAPANSNIYIKDINGDVVATATADANGNFRVKVGVDQASLGTVTVTSLSLGANSLTPYFGVTPGTGPSLTVVGAPTPAQVPTITTPANLSRLQTQTPVLTGIGKASQSVVIMAKDQNGNLLLSNVGTGAVDAGGNYTANVLTNLPQGANLVSVIVDGVSSEVNTYFMTDPFGYVFDSVTNQLIQGATVTIFKSNGSIAVPGVDLDSSDVNPITTAADGFYSFLANNGNYYITVTAEGHTHPSQLTTFPGGRSVISGSKGETFAVAGVVQQIDQPVDGSPALLRVEKVANKKDVKVGDVVTYTVTVQSLLAQNTTNDVLLNDKIPPGFKYLPGRVLIDGVPATDPSGQRPLVFNLANFTPGQTKTIRYQLVVGAGVGPGNYENSAFAKYANGLVISNHATATVRVQIDPLFDAGTIIGKVYFDLNENGKQDEPDYDFYQRDYIIEKPVPNVSLVMEDGTVITTDKNGQFSMPGVVPGRHLLRLDERSLPAGAYLTTDKVVMLDVTPGVMSKVNFGVNLEPGNEVSEDAQFFNNNIRMTQDDTKPTPRLNVDLFNGEVRMFNGFLLEPAEFRIFSNYSPVLESWKLDIIDRDTKKLVKSFYGNRFDITNPIYWDGRDAQGSMIREDRSYSYIVSVEDANHKEDTTQEKPITVNILKDAAAVQSLKEKEKPEDYAKRYREWLDKGQDVNLLAHQNIRMDGGETVRIDPQNTDIRSIRIVKDDKIFAEVPVGELVQSKAMDLAQGTIETNRSRTVDFILPKGEYDIQVISGQGKVGQVETAAASTGTASGTSAAGASTSSSATAKAPAGKSNKYTKKINVGDDYLMFVAMGDGKVGYNFDKGNVEPIQSTDNFKKGFYNQGQLAYFLKGKIKGKYLVTSSFDSSREKKELFKTLDKDTYYPIYGDKSSVNYQATDTQGPLYLLVQWDKSSAIWGNYAIDFNDTEFAKFSRSYYGGKIDYQTLAQTPYSDPRTKVVVFNAQIKQRAAHAEFTGTGGSLYYLKHKDIIEGSDRIRIEIRDQVTGLVTATQTMVAGADYDIDYAQGRILFWQPVAMLAQTSRLITNQLIQGDKVYVVADYEYSAIDKISEASQGTRVQQAVTDNVTVGATYVKEAQESQNYELKGYDTAVHLGPDATVKAEFAQTQAQDVGSFMSTDGGLSFTDLSIGKTATGTAYGISGDARLFDRIGLNSYYKWIEDGFASAQETSQQGKELAGLGLTIDVTPETRLTARQDIQRLMNSTNAQAQLQVGAEQTVTTMAQIVHEARRMRLTGEFQNQQVTNKNEKYETVSATDTSTVAGRVDYALTPKTDVTLQHEAELTGEKGHQTTVGASHQLTDHVSVRGTDSFGSKGSAQSAGVTANTTGKIAVSTDYTIARDLNGVVTGSTTSVGAATQLTNNVALNSNVSRTTSNSGPAVTSVAVGTQAKLTSDINATVGVARSSDGNQVKTVGLGASKQVDDKTAVSSTLNVSQDQTGASSSSLSLGAAQKKDENNDSTAVWTTDQSTGGVRSDTLTLADTRKLNDEYKTSVERTLGVSSDKELKRGNTYSLIREKDGRTLTGSLTRQFADSPTSISQSNIFGLSGDINDKWAMLGALERGNVQNLDGSITDRTAISTGVGYVNKDLETGEELLKSSTKVELRLDSGVDDQRQFVLYNANEGKLTDNMTIFTKFQFSKTEDTTFNTKLAGYKEIVLGSAYRPISNDRLNFITRYTYQENKSPTGQIDTSSANQTSAHIFSADAIYDISEKWQLVEKLAYRISEEKIEGFEFNKTHTWLMVHRLNYNIDRNWQVGGEYRKLTQVEAKDSKQGFLLEATRKINDFAKLGAGYNFTTFNDDLTNLNYTAQGPFLRVTGSAYDRTPEERARARAKWLEERVSRWAWVMVHKELEKPDSRIVREMNMLYAMAHLAEEQGRFEESKQIYTDIVMAGQMMYEEAAQFIRTQVKFEETLQQYSVQADEYFKKGELIKARQLWEKILEEAQNTQAK